MIRNSPEEESLLLAALRRANHRSQFWRKRLSDLGVKDIDLIPGFPFHELPLLSKIDILADQREETFGKLLAVEPSDIRRIHKTSGTSTNPFLIALTERDIEDTYTASIRAFKSAGMGPRDRVAHCLNFNMWSGGVTDYIPIERVKATGIPFGVGNTSMLIKLIREMNVNAISSTPSYMFTIRDRCRDEFGISPRDLGLKRGYFGGEGLLQVPGAREEIEQNFGITAYDANYGMSEITSIIAGETQDRNGLEYHAYGILYVELVDENRADVRIEPGACGELVFSTLRREGQPLFRYRTNDLVEILHSEIGEDGLLRIRMKILGRSDEMLVLRGVNFFPQSIQSIIGQFEPEISRVYRVVRPSDSKDAISILLETSVPEGEQRDVLAVRIIEKISAMLQIKAVITWLPTGAIPQTGNKDSVLINPDNVIIPIKKSDGTQHGG